MKKIIMSVALALIGTLVVAAISSEPAISAFPQDAGYANPTTLSSVGWAGLQPDRYFVALLAP